MACLAGSVQLGQVVRREPLSLVRGQSVPAHGFRVISSVSHVELVDHAQQILCLLVIGLRLGQAACKRFFEVLVAKVPGAGGFGIFMLPSEQDQLRSIRIDPRVERQAIVFIRFQVLASAPAIPPYLHFNAAIIRYCPRGGAAAISIAKSGYSV
jgi:hypothetical protein